MLIYLLVGLSVGVWLWEIPARPCFESILVC